MSGLDRASFKFGAGARHYVRSAAEGMLISIALSVTHGG